MFLGLYVIMMKEKRKFRLLTSKDICQIYKLLYREKFISFPLAQDSEDKVGSLAVSINSSYFGKKLYKSHKEKVVAYLYFLIKAHAFIDGNKRTACLSFSVICNMNKLNPNYKNFSLDELAVFIEKEKRKDYQEFIHEITLVLFY